MNKVHLLKQLSFILLLFVSGVSMANAQAIVSWDKTYAKGKLNFIVANDLGRNGYYDQIQIAEIMGNVAEELRPQGVLCPGDVHHFGGVESVDDPLWMTNYELIYKHPGLMIEWYPVLGNHEYRGNTQPVLDYTAVSRRWEMPERYYAKVFSRKGVSMKVVFIDTTPLIDNNRRQTDVYPEAQSRSIEDQLKWLEQELLDRGGVDWVVVIGHHPIYADSPKPDSEQEDMRERVDSLLRQYNVDMYICGHIHNFQHIRCANSNVDYILNSSASQSRKNVKPIAGTIYCNGSTGFSVLSASKDTLVMHMIDNQGNLLHSVVRDKP